MIEVLNSRVKSKIIKFFATNPKEEITVSEISKKLKISKSRASEILRELEKVKFLQKRKVGKSYLYKLNQESNSTKKLVKFIQQIEEFDLEKLKQKILPLLKKFGVKRASIFGSFARGEAKEKSDIDILIEFDDGKSLLDLIRLEIELEKRLKRKVDLLTYRSLHPLIRKRILEEEVKIYEKR